MKIVKIVMLFCFGIVGFAVNAEEDSPRGLRGIKELSGSTTPMALSEETQTLSQTLSACFGGYLPMGSNPFYLVDGSQTYTGSYSGTGSFMSIYSAATFFSPSYYSGGIQQACGSTNKTYYMYNTLSSSFAVAQGDFLGWNFTLSCNASPLVIITYESNVLNIGGNLYWSDYSIKDYYGNALGYVVNPGSSFNVTNLQIIDVYGYLISSATANLNYTVPSNPWTPPYYPTLPPISYGSTTKVWTVAYTPGLANPAGDPRVIAFLVEIVSSKYYYNNCFGGYYSAGTALQPGGVLPIVMAGLAMLVGLNQALH